MSASETKPTSTTGIVSSSNARRKAFIVGVSSYTNAPLKNPVNDAEDIAQEVRKAEFQVILLKDPTISTFVVHLSQWIQSIQPGDIILFYFSGHGCQYENQNYLLPSDYEGQYDIQLFQHSVAMDLQVLKPLIKREAGCAIILLDCCRVNPFPSIHRAAKFGLAPLKCEGIPSLIGFACAENSVASDNPEERNGLFTKYLLKHLLMPNTDLERALKFVGAGVMNESKGQQCPYRYSNVHQDIVLNRCGDSKSEDADKQNLGEMQSSSTQTQATQSTPPPIQITPPFVPRIRRMEFLSHVKQWFEYERKKSWKQFQDIRLKNVFMIDQVLEPMYMAGTGGVSMLASYKNELSHHLIENAITGYFNVMLNIEDPLRWAEVESIWKQRYENCLKF